MSKKLEKALYNVRDELEHAMGCDEFNYNVVDDWDLIVKELNKLDKIEEVMKNLKELKQEIMTELECEYDEKDNMFYVEGEWGITMKPNEFDENYYVDFDNVIMRIKTQNLITTYFMKLEETNENK